MFRGAVRPSAPETSHAAAKAIAACAGELCQRVHRYIDAQGEHGATDHESQAALGLLMQTQVPRRNALAAAGFVVWSGRFRPTPSGRRARVWVTPRNLKAEGGAR
ncbi:MAG: hypothetical protein KDA05_10525 [Phycisphaerales bacterium]|nr:hypothetical protein [Phycisphaerales bacterium]